MKICVVGKGNVGSHLMRALGQPGCPVDSRTLEGIPVDCDVLLIAVADSAIEDVARRLSLRLPEFKGVVAHTAGSVPMEVLRTFFRHYGVFYPLQTFSKDIDIPDYAEIPVFIEGSDLNAVRTLESVAHRFANHGDPQGTVPGNVFHYDSEKRKALHLASVFACNFTNALYGVSERMLAKEGIPFDTLHALITQTARKATMYSPSECQTGPARRGDRDVMQRHLEMLEGSNPSLSRIYSLLSEEIARASRHPNDPTP